MGYYRKKYEEFLTINFPRVPFPRDRNLFVRISRLGKKLVDMHLLISSELNNPTAKFQGKGDNTVEKPIYDENASRIYINKTQYFERVKKNIWEYHIDGYQVLYIWLKDRKGRRLSLEDIKNYYKVVTALKRTKEIIPAQNYCSLYR